MSAGAKSWEVDRPAKSSAELILPKRGLRRRFLIEIIPCVQGIVAEVFEQRPPKVVRARTSDKRNLRPWLPAELRRISRGLNFKFFKGVNRDEVVGSAEGAQTRKGAGKR